MDLTPRNATPDGSGKSETAGKTKRRILPVLVLVAIIAFGGVVVTKFLSSALDYYCNVDEVGVRSGCESNRRLRVQGSVDQDSLKQGVGVSTFSMSFKGKSLNVQYDGDPGGVFQECIPIVAHGRMVSGMFLSDRIEVKHSNTYATENKDRIDEAEAAACSLPVE